MNTSVSLLSDRALALLGLGVAVSLACSASIAGDPAPNPNPEWDSSWSSNEATFLTNHRQLTDNDRFIKAGESYFSHDGKRIIFQGVPVPAQGDEPLEHYLMYVCDVVRDGKEITGVEHITNVSNWGSSNTCGWFHPKDSSRILFGSTLVAPAGEDVAGYQRDSSKYSWQFPREMDIVEMTLTPAIEGMCCSEMGLSEATPIWERDGYDAEGSWSPDGRFILYTRLEPGSTDGDLWIYDSKDDSHTELIAEPGYDGGPFFSPDGKSICYRSDRRQDKLLQIFVSNLAFGKGGKVTGIKEEIQITNNEHVNWCPFYTPDGKYLFYATSEQSHGNYEVYCVDATGKYPLDETPRMRVTSARGFDGLPVFSPDGKTMMWTGQRGAFVEGNDRPSSQLWVADVNLKAVDKAYRAMRDAMIEQKEQDSFENYMP